MDPGHVALLLAPGGGTCVNYHFCANEMIPWARPLGEMTNED